MATSPSETTLYPGQQHALDPDRPYLTAPQIKRYARGYPLVRVVAGGASQMFHVDGVGMIVFGRPWPIHLPPDPRQIELARQWCWMAPRITTPTINSYSAKHTAERWAGDYISNGALIVAAAMTGIPMRLDDPELEGRFNPSLGISQRWYWRHRDEMLKGGR